MAVLVQLGIDQLGLQPRQRRADGADDVGLRRRAEAAAGGFRQAVGLQHLEAEGLNVAANLGVEARTAGDEVADVRSELSVDFLEEHLAEIEAQLLRCRAEAAASARKTRSASAALFANLAEDALVNEIEELRNAAEDSNAALAQREGQFLRVQRIEKDNLAAVAQRQKKIGHLRQHVEERQTRRAKRLPGRWG